MGCRTDRSGFGTEHASAAAETAGTGRGRGEGLRCMDEPGKNGGYDPEQNLDT